MLRIRLTASVISLLIAIPLFASRSWGSEADNKRYFSAGIEAARWQEFDNTNQRLLSEQGLRLALQANWEDILPDFHFAQLNLIGRYYGGRLDYNGQTQSLDPLADGIFVASTSRYNGLTVEVEGQRPFARRNNAVLAGLGIDFWRRDIQDSRDARGNPVTGFIEDYQVVYARLGLQQQTHGQYGSRRSRFGIKYPLYITEQPGATIPDLHPGRDWSIFAAYRLQLADQHHTIIEIYFDSLRLEQSPAVVDQFGNPWLQPRSHQDSIGILFGVPF